MGDDELNDRAKEGISEHVLSRTSDYLSFNLLRTSASGLSKTHKVDDA